MTIFLDFTKWPETQEGGNKRPYTVRADSIESMTPNGNATLMRTTSGDVVNIEGKCEYNRQKWVEALGK